MSLIQHRVAPLEESAVALAIGEENGRAILAACVDRPRSVKEICAATGTPTTTAYRQVHRLERLGVLVVERSAMTLDGRKYDLYRSRLRAARIDIDEQGLRVQWEANAEVEQRLASMWERLHVLADAPPRKSFFLRRDDVLST